MPAAVGLGPIGQNEKKNTNTRNTMEMMFSGRPARPRLNFDGSNGSPRMRLSAMQDILTIYDAMIAQVESEAIFRSAAEEPRLMSESRHDTAKERHMALIGTFHFGGTYTHSSVSLGDISRELT